MFPWEYSIIALAAYLLGCINVGLFVGKLIGKTDIRQHGSGNAGSTNMLRVLGWGPSLLTLIGDTGKAVLAVLIGYWWMGLLGAYIGGMFVIIGHNWPVFFRFKGGKGVAATLGITLVLLPWMGIIGVATVALTVILFGFVSLGSILSFLFMPLFYYLTNANTWDWWGLGFFLLLSAFGLFSHRTNIKRLLTGKENKLNVFKKKEQA